MLSIIRFIKWGQADVGLMDFLLLIIPLNGWNKFNAERGRAAAGPPAPQHPTQCSEEAHWPWQWPGDGRQASSRQLLFLPSS